ncbi:hypothetical protein Tco_1289770 [Tanacetum coccineum]
MAQQVITTAQLVSRYHTIGRYNNYAVLQSIPCSPECKIVGKILLDHPLSYALTAIVDVLVWKLLKKPFVALVNIQTIEAFMNMVFNRCLTTRTSGHNHTKINILQLFHVVINRANVDYAALLWWDFMNNVFQKKEAIWIDEDYHSINDDIPLASVYSIGNVLRRGMLILDEFLTEEIHATDDFTKSTPRAYRTPTVSTASPQGKKRKQIVRESSSPQKSLKITIRQKQVVNGEKDDDDSEDRFEPGSHKENPEHVDDDDDEEKVDEKKDTEMGSIETRTGEKQTPIPTTPRSPRTILSSDKNISALRMMCRHQGDDDIHSQRHDDHQEDDAPLEGEKRVKRHKASRSSKFVRGSSSKHSAKDSTTYVSK